MNGSRAKGHRGGIRGTKDTRVPSCTPWGRGLEGHARCSEKSYHGSLEKAVRGTRWHFKSTLPPEREFVPASPTVTGGLGPTPTAPPMAGHADAPGGRAAAPREAAGSALEVVNQATWADQSGPSLDLMQLLPHWLPTLRSAWEPTAEPTTSQQLSARTKTPAKSLLIVPWPWSDRRRPEPERVFSEHRPPAESLRHLCPCSSGIGDGFGAGVPRALGGSACPGKLARLSCSLSPFSNQEHTLSDKSHLAGESGRGGAVGKSHRTGATPRGLSPILPRRLARKELMLARPGVASQRGGWPARETSLQVGRVTSQPPLIPKKSQRNP